GVNTALAAAQQGSEKADMAFHFANPLAFVYCIAGLVADHKAIRLTPTLKREVPAKIFLPEFVRSRNPAALQALLEPTAQVIAEAAQVDEVALGLGRVESPALEGNDGA